MSVMASSACGMKGILARMERRPGIYWSLTLGFNSAISARCLVESVRTSGPSQTQGRKAGELLPYCCKGGETGGPPMPATNLGPMMPSNWRRDAGFLPVSWFSVEGHGRALQQRGVRSRFEWSHPKPVWGGEIQIDWMVNLRARNLAGGPESKCQCASRIWTGCRGFDVSWECGISGVAQI